MLSDDCIIYDLHCKSRARVPSGDVFAVLAGRRRGLRLADAACRPTDVAAAPGPVAAADDGNEPTVPTPVVVLAEYWMGSCMDDIRVRIAQILQYALLTRWPRPTRRRGGGLN